MPSFVLPAIAYVIASVWEDPRAGHFHGGGALFPPGGRITGRYPPGGTPRLTGGAGPL
jgi:hypothetical protein